MAVLQMQKISICALKKRSKSSSGKASEDEGDGDQPDSGGGS